MPSASALLCQASSMTTGSGVPPMAATEEVSTARRTPERCAASSTSATLRWFTPWSRASSPDRKCMTPAACTTPSQPRSARSTEGRSVTSPRARSTSSPSRLARELMGRTSARTAWPRARSSRTTQEPTKPVAPVTRTCMAGQRGKGGAPAQGADGATALVPLGPGGNRDSRPLAALARRLPQGDARLAALLEGGRHPGRLVAVEGDAQRHLAGLLVEPELDRGLAQELTGVEANHLGAGRAGAHVQ